MDEKIRVQIGQGESKVNLSDYSSFSKVPSSRIQFNRRGLAYQAKIYKQREGDYSIEEEDDVPDLLNADYPSLVET